jgi:tRNA(Ser,Leu) C12 N-acetylase TAN1
MYTTYHLSSAQEVNADILESIKAAFKSKPIRIIVETDEDEMEGELTDKMKAILDERLLEDKSDYIPAEQLVADLKRKYGL